MYAGNGGVPGGCQWRYRLSEKLQLHKRLSTTRPLPRNGNDKMTKQICFWTILKWHLSIMNKNGRWSVTFQSHLLVQYRANAIAIDNRIDSQYKDRRIISSTPLLKYLRLFNLSSSWWVWFTVTLVSLGFRLASILYFILIALRFGPRCVTPPVQIQAYKLWRFGPKPPIIKKSSSNPKLDIES
jgi:hypothetical protein